MKTMSAHARASRPWATWYDRPSPPVTRPGAAPHTRTSYGMLARVVKTCAGMPTSRGLAPSRTRTAARRRRGDGTGRAYAGGDRRSVQAEDVHRVLGHAPLAQGVGVDGNEAVPEEQRFDPAGAGGLAGVVAGGHPGEVHV